jgi:hypothetical protein
MAERLPSAVTAFLACKIGARYRRAVIIASRRGSAIGSLTDWEVLGKPASPEHWKPGRSAYELAQDWIEGDAASDVIALLSARTELSGIELLEGVAEKQTQFDGISRGPRNHDLLVRGRLPDGASITVGVEGKADEPFDVPLWRYRENALKRSSQTQALARTDGLVRQFFGTSLAADKGEPPIICMGYQLLSALAGTLADAKNDGSPYAVVLIMEYITDLTDDAEHAHNGRVLENFLARLLGVEAERSHTPLGWITAPRSIRGDGSWATRSTEVSFAKLVRHRRSAT